MGRTTITKQRKKYSTDPNNHRWASSTSTFGHRLLRSQGWTPGTVLGPSSSPHAAYHTKASRTNLTARIRLDESAGVGFAAPVGGRIGMLVDPREIHGGLDDIFARLNGKAKVVAGKTEEEERRAREERERKGRGVARAWGVGRYGMMRFVKGGWLVGDEVRDILDEELAEKEGIVGNGEKAGLENGNVEVKAVKEKSKKRKERSSGDEAEDDAARKKRRKQEKRLAQSSSGETEKATRPARSPSDDPKEEETGRKKRKMAERQQARPPSDEPDPDDSAKRKRRKEEKRLAREAKTSQPSTQLETPSSTSPQPPAPDQGLETPAAAPSKSKKDKKPRSEPPSSTSSVATPKKRSKEAKEEKKRRKAGTLQFAGPEVPAAAAETAEMSKDERRAKTKTKKSSRKGATDGKGLLDRESRRSSRVAMVEV